MRNLRLIADELIKKIYLFFGRKINAGYEFELAFRGAQSHCCYEGETLWKHPTAIYSPAESARRIDKYWVRQSIIFGNTLRCDTRTPHVTHSVSSFQCKFNERHFHLIAMILCFSGWRWRWQLIQNKRGSAKWMRVRRQVSLLSNKWSTRAFFLALFPVLPPTN